MNPAINLILIGPMGAGKTAVGKHLGKRLGLRFVDADNALEAQTGADIATIFHCEGEAGFRRRESAMLAQLLADSGQVIATGGGVILAEQNRALLRQHRPVVWLQVDTPTQLQRLRHDRSRPLLDTDDRAARLQALAAARNPLYSECADIVIDTRGHLPSYISRKIIRHLQPFWQSFHP